MNVEHVSRKIENPILIMPELQSLMKTFAVSRAVYCLTCEITCKLADELGMQNRIVETVIHRHADLRMCP